MPQGALWTLGVDFWGLDALLQGVLQGAGSTLNLGYTLQHRYTAGCRCFAGCTLAFRWDGGALGSNDSKDRVKGKEHQLASAIIHPTLIIALALQYIHMIFEVRMKHRWRQTKNSLHIVWIICAIKERINKTSSIKI